MADAAPDDEDKALMERALEELELLRSRISALLLREAGPGTARVTANDRDCYLLKFIDMELSAVLAARRRHLALKEQGADRVVHDEGMEQDWLPRIHQLALEEQGADRIIHDQLARAIDSLLDRYDRPPPCHAVLLHKAARCCCRRIAEPDHWWLFAYIANLLAFVTQHLLMYHHRLHYRLKPLLLYMLSMFPQGYKFDKNRLISKWASERLTGGYDWYYGVSKAEEYFSELVDEGVIIQAANYGHKPAAEAEDWRWQVNPDMLQFLASESADKGFVCTISMLKSAAAGGNSDSTEILRRLSLHQPDPELPTLLESMDLSHTRSLAVSGAVDRIPLGKFIYLRVLDLEGWENLKDEDLRQQICGTTFLLRYLSVRNTGVTRLPPEIKELRCLGALDVSHTKITELPPEIKELRSLEALDVSHTKISELPPEAYKIPWLRTLDLRSTQVRQLPEQIVALTNLSALLVGGDGINPDETVAKIPEGIVRCGHLRTLATVDLSEWSARSMVHRFH